MSNVNTGKDGIRYGVIACNSLNQDLVQELWYGVGARDVSWEQAVEELRAEITSEVMDEQEDGYDIDDVQDEIDDRVESRKEWIQIEEPTIVGCYEGIEYQIGWLGGAPLLWVMKSPVKTFARLCSPCVPNAGDLDNVYEGDPNEYNPGYSECYDVPADWRAAE